jgi:hypothetical protein
MKTTNKNLLLFALLLGTFALLISSVQRAVADGGGFPTSTPTFPVATIIVITPEGGKDEASVEIQGDAPLPNAQNESQPAAVIQAAPMPDPLTAASPAAGGGNLRMLLTFGGIFLVVLVVGFIIFRLRS